MNLVHVNHSSSENCFSVFGVTLDSDWLGVFVLWYFKGKSQVRSDCFQQELWRKNNHLLSEQSATNKITHMDLNYFFSPWYRVYHYQCADYITGYRCTAYPGSLGFLMSVSQAANHCVSDLSSISPVTYSWAGPSAPVRLPSLCLDHAWACSLAMQRGKIPSCMMSELKHQSKAEQSLREALNSLPSPYQQEEWGSSFFTAAA